MNLKTLFVGALLAAAFLHLPISAHAQALLQQQGDTSHGFSVLVVDQTTGAPDTGLTLTMRVTKQPGTSSVAGTGTFTETDSTNQKGYYFYAPSAADVGTLGDTIFQPTATAGTGFANALINSRAVDVVAFNPYSATNLGLSALPTANPGASGGLPTANSSNQVAVSNFPATVSLSSGDETTLAGLTANFTGLPALIWGYGSGRTVTGGTITTYTGNTPQTGDPYLLATTGAGVKIASGQSTSANNLPTDYQQRGVAVTLPATPPTGYGGSGSSTDPLTNPLSIYTTPGTAGYSISQFLTGNAYVRLGVPAGDSVSADIAANAVATVTALKADPQWQKLFAYSAGKYTVSGNVVTFYAADDTTPLFSLTLTKDTNGVITARAHS